MLSESAQKLLFLEARTHSYWQPKEVADALLVQIYDLMKWAPTSANCSPARLVFIKSQPAKEKLKPCLAPGNVEKTMSAPVTVLLGHDPEFYEKLPKLFPHADAKAWFIGNQDLIDSTAFRNGTLQAAYFMLAARGLGLDCGPMSGFDSKMAEAAFFAGTAYRANFLCNLGYGDAAKLHERSPRLEFSEAAVIV